MKKIYKHIVNSLIAGVVAILPLGGMILMIGYLESTISNSGLSRLPFYFPGLGLLAAVVFIYLIGLLVTTFIGKWIWKKVDQILDMLPLLGRIYQTLKQILGYGEGKDAIFYEAVLVPSKDTRAEELGLVTNTIMDAEGKTKSVVFIPGVPNPTSGRLLIMDKESMKPLSISVNEALKALVSIGKTDIELKSGDGGSGN
ncbi:MAG: DUF502 domain-containing protein [Candidatus Aureabacteria bacterium]|nr:DUF502 domain-containing protein [Candidatus Auribacterota bacterium]